MINEEDRERRYPHWELTRKIIGSLFDVFKQLGYDYQKKYYQRALVEELKELDIEFQREKFIPIRFKNKIIGRYFMDFIIRDVLVIELKVANDFYESHINQILAYMKHGDFRIGLLAIITKRGIKVKRLIN